MFGLKYLIDMIRIMRFGFGRRVIASELDCLGSDRL